MQEIIDVAADFISARISESEKREEKQMNSLSRASFN
jgi:hypothetical protein